LSGDGNIVHFYYQLYFFYSPAIFFSYNKSVNINLTYDQRTELAGSEPACAGGGDGRVIFGQHAARPGFIFLGMGPGVANAKDTVI